MDALTLLMASLSLSAPANDLARDTGASSRLVDTNGTASVRIVKAYRLKRETMSDPVEGALLRTTTIIDRDGQRRDIDLVEFE